MRPRGDTRDAGAARRGRARGAAYLLAPLAFAWASLLSFWVANADELGVADIAPSFGWYSLGVLAVTGVLLLVLRDVFRTVVVASALSAAFFYYGYLYRALAGVSLGVGRLSVGPDIVLWVGVGAAMVALVAITFRPPQRTALVAKTLAVVGASLLLTSTALTAVTWAGTTGESSEARAIASADDAARNGLVEGGSPRARAASSSAGTDSLAAGGSPTPSGADGRAPDIFFIVLDGYASNRSIAEFSGYDNSPFTDALERRGFYVAPDAMSNYSTTFLSLAATTNMRYLTQDLEGIRGANRARIYALVSNNRLARKLRENGYRYIHVTSGWGSTNSAPLADRVLRVGGGEVDLAINDATMFRPFNDVSSSKKKYRAVRKAFAHLEGVKSSSKRPTFVWAHILVPHGPYVFKADGSFTAGTSSDMRNWKNDTKDDYVAQLRAVNRLVERFVARRMRDSKRPLIIVIQADHGTNFPSGKRERVWLRRHSILNALYFSEGAPTSLYPAISPVNTFRVVLNEAIGADYALLPDRSFHSLKYATPYELTDVTERLRQAAARQ